MFMKLLYYVILVFFIILVVSDASYSQNSRLKGVVFDAVKHKEIDSVFVSIISQDSVCKYNVYSANSGIYYFENIYDAKYNVSASKRGYEFSQIRGVLVKENNITFMDINLTPIKKSNKRKHFMKK